MIVTEAILYSLDNDEEQLALKYMAEVRRLIGLNFNTDDISDDAIRSKVFFGAAFNTIFESVVLGLKSRPADAASLSVLFTASIRDVQADQFNRAVQYRTAGLLVGSAEFVTSEGAGSVSQTYLREQKAERQTYLFGLADDEIRKLREALPNDLFASVPVRSDLLSGATFFSTAGKASTPSGQAGGAPTPSGSGLPSGGSAGQFLSRTADGYAWVTIGDGNFTPANAGTAGQILTKTAGGYTWQAAPSGLPSGGESGEYLQRTAIGYRWQSIPSYESFNPSNTGRSGQILTKTDTGYQWSNSSGGGFTPTNAGVSGQLLTKTKTGYEWDDNPIPAGETGQFLQKTAGGVAFADVDQFHPRTEGVTDQILAKTDTGYDWTTPPVSLPSGGASGQYLQRTSDGYRWQSIPTYTSFSPSNTGTTGQILKRTSAGYSWQNETTYTSFAPTNTGSTGQYLTKTAGGYQWSTSTAQANAPHVVKFAGTDTDTSTDIDPSQIGFYNNTTQVQSGNLGQVNRLYIPNAGATFGQDATQPGTDLDAVDTSPFFDDILDNGGSVLFAISRVGQSQISYVQTDTITTYTGGYLLTDLTWFNPYTITGTGYAWNIVAAFSTGNFAEHVIDLASVLSAYATKAELAGHEQDRYASYTNAFVQNSYKRGSIVLTTDTSGTPTQANQVRQPDIASGTGMLAVSAFLRTDADPNQLAWAAESNASDYTTGDIFYLSLDRDKGSYLKVELTGNGVKTGTGDGAYIYALATFTEVGNVANVATAGDYFKISEVIPSSLQIEIPYTDILGAPWLNVDGSNVTQDTKDAIQGDNESVTLTPDFRVNATNVDYYAAWTEASKQLQIRLPSSQANTQTDTDLQRLLHASAWVKIGTWVGQITTNATRSVIGTSLTFASNYNTLEGTIPTDGATYKITVVGEDVHRGEIGDWAFNAEVSNTPATGQVLTKTATGFQWQAVLGDGDQQQFVSGTWTSYSGQEFNDNDLIGLCLSPTENGYGQIFCIRFGDVTTTGGQIHSSGGNTFNGRRSGGNYQIQRTAGTGGLYVRLFVLGQNSS